jgi:ferredoxin-like protein FixX
MKQFPALQTKRLMLREFRSSDARAVFAVFSQDAATRHHNVETRQSVEQAAKRSRLARACPSGAWECAGASCRESGEMELSVRVAANT